jgi:pre-mRNA-splicing factor CWC26
VQTAQARQRRERLEEAALMPLARGKDDVEMNEEMRQAERWNDPMAEFLAAAEEPAAAGKGGGGGKKKGGRRPVYKGAAAPNRYGIRPGYRWDGVDRGTGFEGERFRALNRKERDKGLEYAWQMDV